MNNKIIHLFDKIIHKEEQFMRKSMVDGVAYFCPTYLVRAGDGWQVRMPEEPTIMFSDGVYGGVRKSFDEALRVRVTKGPITDLRYPLAQHEKKNKQRLTGTPGIILYSYIPKGRKVRKYKLLIRVSNLPRKTVYIGTENTWENRYPEKLAKACQSHHQLTQQFLQQESAAQQ